nr:HNH endonuclease family protein [Bradyrhizobium erythrophlei]
MQRLDEALSSGGASYDELVSIEHVLPQTVDDGSEWEQLFPDEQERSDWTHRLANLVFLTHRINSRASNWDFERKRKEYFASSDGSSPFVITQGVLQAEGWTPEHLGERQTQLLERLCEVWDLKAVDLEAEIVNLLPQKGTWRFTDTEIIKAKRSEILEALSNREKVALNKKGALSWTDDEGVRVVSTISKRYDRRAAPYWYGYSPEWRKFLSGAQRSFLVLGCVDRNTAYAIPAQEIEKIIDDLHMSPAKRDEDSTKHTVEASARHWHIVLDDNDDGGLDLVPRKGSRIPVKKFELKLTE